MSEEKTLAQADRQAKQAIANWTAGNALVGWIPGSYLVLAPADTAMVTQIAGIYEVSAWDMDNLTSTLTASLGSAIAGGVLIEGIGVIPIVGWAVKSAAMAAKSNFIGTEIMKYFRRRSPLKNKSIDIEIE